MEFGILGPLEVRTDERVVDLRRGKPRALLIALLLRRGDAVSADALLDAAWGDDQPRNPANALQVQISYLRRTLGEASAEAGQVIVTRGEGYALDVPADRVDAARFEQKLSRGMSLLQPESVALAAALEELEEALALWRGEALADVAGAHFAVGEATRLNELRWTAVEARNDALLRLGRHRELIGPLSRLVTEYPLREGFHEQLIVALYRGGRQAEALRAYEDARRELVEELGIDPGPRLRELEQRVLRQDPALEWTPAVASGQPPLPPHQSEATPATLPTLVARPQAALPNPVTPLIGRDFEVQRVGELLARSRLVTLSGPGGAGKTRLALELAHRQAATREVWFIELSPAAEDAAVAPTVAAALGIPTVPGEDPAALVAGALALEHGLLVLDTCEHVIDGVGALVSRILRETPTVTVLATSRRALSVHGEIAWPVPPLAVAPPDVQSASEAGEFAAVALFCERAAAVRPAFEITDDTAADIAAICLGLDGLPLAIELAAARVDVLTPAAIRARLQNRFDLLVDGGRDAVARQQTLLAAVAWSADLLTDEERTFFTRLAVFPGSFDLDAALAVAGAQCHDPLRLLTALVRQSMLDTLGDGRFRLLDTLRAYAVSTLAGQDEAADRQRHAQFYVDLAEAAERGVQGPDQLDWLRRIRADVPNFHAAIDWALARGEDAYAARLVAALSWFWILEGMLQVAIAYAERTAACSGVTGELRSRVLWALAALSAPRGDLERTLEYGQASADVAETAGDNAGVGRGLTMVGLAHWARGDIAMAAAVHDEALARFDKAGDVWGRGVVTALRARTAVDAGHDAAEALTADVVRAGRQTGDRHILGIGLELRARLALRNGDHAAARAAAAECLSMHESIGYLEGTISGLNLLARAHVAVGEAHAARELSGRALRLAVAIGHAAARCEALEGMARAAAAAGANDDALRLLVLAAEERRDHGIPIRRPDADDIAELRQRVERDLGPAAAAAIASVGELSSDAVAASLG